LLPVKKRDQKVLPMSQQPQRIRRDAARKDTFRDAYQKAVRSSSVTFCVLLLCLLLVGVSLISLYGRVVAVKIQMHGVYSEISQLQSEKEHLLLEVKSLNSLERIEMIAITELGLQYPESRQWLRLAARGE